MIMAAPEASNDLTVKSRLKLGGYLLTDKMDAPLYWCVIPRAPGAPRTFKTLWEHTLPLLPYHSFDCVERG